MYHPLEILISRYLMGHIKSALSSTAFFRAISGRNPVKLSCLFRHCNRVVEVVPSITATGFDCDAVA